MRAAYSTTWLSLFASASTLLCCALPILLVTLGMGAAVAALTTNVPVLVTLSDHKAYLFALSALALGVAGWTVHRAGRSCPADPREAAACTRAQRAGRRVLGIAALVWVIGFVAAYVALPLRLAIGL